MLLPLLLVAPLACTLFEASPPSPVEEKEESPAARLPEPAATTEPTAERYAASHVVVAHVGAARVPDGVTRSEEEAHQRAVDIWRRLEEGESIEELAVRYSDGPSAPRKGRIGVYPPGTMMPEFEAAVAAVGEGQVTRPFKTAFGWHVARRDAVVEAEARHILVGWKGAVRSASRRSKEQARAVIERAAARLAAGEAFEVVAKEVGEDATAPRGGDLGVVARGQLIPSFDDALFALSAGEQSGIVETPYGFHLIERLR